MSAKDNNHEEALHMIKQEHEEVLQTQLAKYQEKIAEARKFHNDAFEQIKLEHAD